MKCKFTGGLLNNRADQYDPLRSWGGSVFNPKNPKATENFKFGTGYFSFSGFLRFFSFLVFSLIVFVCFYVFKGDLCF